MFSFDVGETRLESTPLASARLNFTLFKKAKIKVYRYDFARNAVWFLRTLDKQGGSFIVWLFVVTYFAIPILFSGSSKGTLPQEVTVSLVLDLLIAMALGWGGILVFLVIFLALWERRRSLREIFSSVGLKKKGAVKTVF